MTIERTDTEAINWVLTSGRNITLGEKLENGETAVAVLDCLCPGSGESFQVLTNIGDHIAPYLDEVRKGDKSEDNNITGFLAFAVFLPEMPVLPE